MIPRFARRVKWLTNKVGHVTKDAGHTTMIATTYNLPISDLQMIGDGVTCASAALGGWSAPLHGSDLERGM